MPFAARAMQRSLASALVADTPTSPPPMTKSEGRGNSDLNSPASDPMNTARRHLTPTNQLAFGAGGETFVAAAVLDGIVRAGEAVRRGPLLTLKDGRRFLLEDALRVLGRRTSETDPYGLIGRVLPLRDLLKRGALLAADGVRMGVAVYDAEQGAILVPLTDAVAGPPGGAPADESGQVPVVR